MATDKKPREEYLQFDPKTKNWNNCGRPIEKSAAFMCNFESSDQGFKSYPNLTQSVCQTMSNFDA